ncbi:hypothetical protein Q1695_016214 [Nippostrongylus brasiliensis]|nr:hypothetical protein Q1695_016214 [Nippostrongylus brasiliensis]
MVASSLFGEIPGENIQESPFRGVWPNGARRWSRSVAVNTLDFESSNASSNLAGTYDFATTLANTIRYLWSLQRSSVVASSLFGEIPGENIQESPFRGVWPNRARRWSRSVAVNTLDFESSNASSNLAGTYDFATTLANTIRYLWSLQRSSVVASSLFGEIPCENIQESPFRGVWPNRARRWSRSVAVNTLDFESSNASSNLAGTYDFATTLANTIRYLWSLQRSSVVASSLFGEIPCENIQESPFRGVWPNRARRWSRSVAVNTLDFESSNASSNLAGTYDFATTLANTIRYLWSLQRSSVVASSLFGEIPCENIQESPFRGVWPRARRWLVEKSRVKTSRKVRFEGCGLIAHRRWSRSVAVNTLDFESSNASSNLAGTYDFATTLANTIRYLWSLQRSSVVASSLFGEIPCENIQESPFRGVWPNRARRWSRSVAVNTLDFESSNASSNLAGTYDFATTLANTIRYLWSLQRSSVVASSLFGEIPCENIQESPFRGVWPNRARRWSRSVAVNTLDFESSNASSNLAGTYDFATTLANTIRYLWSLQRSSVVASSLFGEIPCENIQESPFRGVWPNRARRWSRSVAVNTLDFESSNASSNLAGTYDFATTLANTIRYLWSLQRSSVVASSLFGEIPGENIQESPFRGVWPNRARRWSRSVAVNTLDFESSNASSNLAGTYDFATTLANTIRYLWSLQRSSVVASSLFGEIPCENIQESPFRGVWPNRARRWSRSVAVNTLDFESSNASSNLAGTYDFATTLANTIRYLWSLQRSSVVASSLFGEIPCENIQESPFRGVWPDRARRWSRSVAVNTLDFESSNASSNLAGTYDFATTLANTIRYLWSLQRSSVVASSLFGEIPGENIQESPFRGVWPNRARRWSRSVAVNTLDFESSNASSNLAGTYDFATTLANTIRYLWSLQRSSVVASSLFGEIPGENIQESPFRGVWPNRARRWSRSVAVNTLDFESSNASSNLAGTYDFATTLANTIRYLWSLQRSSVVASSLFGEIPGENIQESPFRGVWPNRARRWSRSVAVNTLDFESSNASSNLAGTYDFATTLANTIRYLWSLQRSSVVASSLFGEIPGENIQESPFRGVWPNRARRWSRSVAVNTLDFESSNASSNLAGTYDFATTLANTIRYLWSLQRSSVVASSLFGEIPCENIQESPFRGVWPNRARRWSRSVAVNTLDFESSNASSNLAGTYDFATTLANTIRYLWSLQRSSVVASSLFGEIPGENIQESPFRGVWPNRARRWSRSVAVNTLDFESSNASSNLAGTYDFATTLANTIRYLWSLQRSSVVASSLFGEIPCENIQESPFRGVWPNRGRRWSRSVAVNTLDFESSNASSNLAGTYDFATTLANTIRYLWSLQRSSVVASSLFGEIPGENIQESPFRGVWPDRFRRWSRSVAVNTLDFESSNASSNLAGTYDFATTLANTIRYLWSLQRSSVVASSLFGEIPGENIQESPFRGVWPNRGRRWSRSVAVNTLDFESSNASSNLAGTYDFATTLANTIRYLWSLQRSSVVASSLFGEIPGENIQESPFRGVWPNRARRWSRSVAVNTLDFESSNASSNLAGTYDFATTLANTIRYLWSLQRSSVVASSLFGEIPCENIQESPFRGVWPNRARRWSRSVAVNTLDFESSNASSNLAGTYDFATTLANTIRYLWSLQRSSVVASSLFGEIPCENIQESPFRGVWPNRARRWSRSVAVNTLDFESSNASSNLAGTYDFATTLANTIRYLWSLQRSSVVASSLFGEIPCENIQESPFRGVWPNRARRWSRSVAVNTLDFESSNASSNLAGTYDFATTLANTIRYLWSLQRFSSVVASSLFGEIPCENIQESPFRGVWPNRARRWSRSVAVNTLDFESSNASSNLAGTYDFATTLANTIRYLWSLQRCPM